MKCPICGGKTTVYDSRPYKTTVYRRRRCEKCGYKFFTEEKESQKQPKFYLT